MIIYLPQPIQILLELNGDPVATVPELEMGPNLQNHLVVLDRLGDGHLHLKHEGDTKILKK